MRCILILAGATALAFAADIKPLPGQAGNDDVELVGSVIIDRQDVKDAVGMYLGPGYVAVRMKITPKTDKPMPISPDDFTLICRKDGQRSQALTPGEIAGKTAMVVKRAATQPGGYGTTTNGPIWGGVGGIGGSRPPGSGHPSASPTSPDADPKLEAGKDGKDDKDNANPLMDALKAKGLPEKESKEPLEGLLYFTIDGKFKPKDLALSYKGAGGRLVMEFANPK